MFSDDLPDQLDYVRSSFELLISLELDVNNPHQLLLLYDLDFSVPEFQEHIESNRVGLYLDVRCKKTFYSEKFEVQQSGTLEIDMEVLRDAVSVYPFMLAKQDFLMRSDRIHEDFEASQFFAEKNSVLAWCPPTTFSVEKELFRSVRSIIDYLPAEVPFGDYIVDCDNEYVTIFASSKFIEKCRKAERNSAAKMPLIGCFFVSVVAEILMTMADRAQELEERRWFQVMQAKCEELNLDYEDKTCVFKNTQTLLKSPLSTIAEKEFIFDV
jgi:hypothetical protein